MVNIISHQCFEADVESFNPLGPVFDLLRPWLFY